MMMDVTGYKTFKSFTVLTEALQVLIQLKRYGLHKGLITVLFSKFCQCSY